MTMIQQQQTNYGMDINNLLTIFNQQGHHLEGFVLQLDDLLSNLEEMTPDMEKLVDITLEALHGVADEG